MPDEGERERDVSCVCVYLCYGNDVCDCTRVDDGDDDDVTLMMCEG